MRPTDPRREAQIARSVEIGNAVEEVPVAEFMTVEEMLARCVLVTTGKRVMLLPPEEGRGLRARLMTLDEFVETFQSSGTMTPEGWVSHAQVWRRSPDRKMVEEVALGIGRPRILTPKLDRPTLNLWTPPVRRQPTARGLQLAGKFLEHVKYLVPIEDERLRFLQWLAHCEQRPAELPHAAYLMVAEQHGIGRNWMAAVLARVWKGETAPAVNLQKLIDSDFNGQIAGKRLAVVDECYIESVRSRHHVESAFRELITADLHTVNPKYGRQYVAWNVVRWLLFTNYWNAMPMPEVDRRNFVIQNPNICQPSDYYAELYNMVEEQELIDAVAHYLATLDLSGFNPGEKPPINAAKQRVIEAGRNDFESALVQVLESWPYDVAAVTDLFAELEEEPEGKTAVQFSAIMGKRGWQKLARVSVSGKKVRVWLKPGAKMPGDVAAAVLAYREAAGF